MISCVSYFSAKMVWSKNCISCMRIMAWNECGYKRILGFAFASHVMVLVTMWFSDSLTQLIVNHIQILIGQNIIDTVLDISSIIWNLGTSGTEASACSSETVFSSSRIRGSRRGYSASMHLLGNWGSAISRKSMCLNGIFNFIAAVNGQMDEGKHRNIQGKF
jgi:hypothetical protein